MPRSYSGSMSMTASQNAAVVESMLVPARTRPMMSPHISTSALGMDRSVCPCADSIDICQDDSQRCECSAAYATSLAVPAACTTTTWLLSDGTGSATEWVQGGRPGSSMLEEKTCCEDKGKGGGGVGRLTRTQASSDTVHF